MVGEVASEKRKGREDEKSGKHKTGRKAEGKRVMQDEKDCVGKEKNEASSYLKKRARLGN